MSLPSLPPPHLAYLFEFLNLQSAVRLSRTSHLMNAVFRRARIREPDEIAFAFYFSKIHTRQNEPVLMCGVTDSSGRTVKVSIVFEDKLPTSSCRYANPVVLKHVRPDHYVVTVTNNASLEKFFTILFNHFGSYLPTKMLTFNISSPPLIRAVTNWIYAQGRRSRWMKFYCSSRIIDDSRAGHARPPRDDREVGEAIAECLWRSETQITVIRAPATFSAEHMKKISENVQHFTAFSPQISIYTDEDLLRTWSPKSLIINAGKTTIKAQSVLDWIMHERRAKNEQLSVTLPFGSSKIIFDAILADRQFTVYFFEPAKCEMTIGSTNVVLMRLEFFEIPRPGICKTVIRTW